MPTPAEKPEQKVKSKFPHVYMSIWCPTYQDHMNFEIKNGRFICKTCGEDFTNEAIQVELMLREQLKMK